MSTAKPQTVLDLLRLGRERVAAGWVKGVYEDLSDPEHPRYCALGAIECDDEQLTDAADDALWSANDGLNPANYNDAQTTTHADILALYDRAIAAAELSEGGR